ncbi:MAG: NADH-quinone oxidoreductase subunit J, partial [Azoarcus sp.]|nr:NADH-quinone oxidoreductase subunit J [Azoarcus sp.]
NKLREGFWRYLPLGALVGALLAVEMALVLGGAYFGLEAMPTPAAKAADYSNTQALGRVLYTDYVYPFELVAFVLLIAMVAAVSLTLRRRRASKYIAPETQVSVRHEGRVRLVKMRVEKENPAAAEAAGDEAEKGGGQ